MTFGKRQAYTTPPRANSVLNNIRSGDVPLKFAIPVITVCALPLLFGLVVLTHMPTVKPCTKAMQEATAAMNEWTEREKACKETKCLAELNADLPKVQQVRRYTDAICQAHPLND